MLSHGINISNIPTSVIPPVKTPAGIPVYFGTAPINLAAAGAGANGVGVTNVPVLCESLSDCTNQLGYSADWTDFTLCEAMYAHFQLFGVGPVIFVNVLDPTVHKTVVSEAAITLAAGTLNTEVQGVLLSTLVVQLTTAGANLVKNVDYTADFDTNGNLIISQIVGGAITSTSSALVIPIRS
jgi:hypothetical protein